MTKRRWLITGVSGGLGRAIADAALARGDQVTGTLRKDAANFSALATGRSHAVTLDLGDSSGIDEAVAYAADQMGGIDILVNNAGYCLAGAVEEISDAEAQAMFAVNLFAPLAMARAALPHLRASPRAHIINISSMAAIEAYVGLGLYCASKAALSALSDVLGLETSPFHIPVTAVEAGGMRTDFAGASLRVAATQRPEYREMREQLVAGFAKSNGKQVNRPDVMAQQIVALTDHPTPPSRLILGEGAASRAIAALDQRRANYDR
jgi:NAD(P)-dependent dehydrogenase (short-subunit alcohol dehydrogenase family)